MNKKLSEWTIDEMESLYMQLGSFRKCAKELCCDPKTFRKYYDLLKNKCKPTIKQDWSSFASGTDVDWNNCRLK